MGILMDILTRTDALRLGAKTYYTGNPCRYGHISYRYTSSGACADCIKSANGHTPTESAAPRKDLGADRTGAAQEFAEQRRAHAEKNVMRTRLARNSVRCTFLAHELDMPHLREYALFQVSTMHPELTYDDVIRDDHFRDPGRYSVWVPSELRDIITDEANRLYKLRYKPVEAPDFGILTATKLKKYFIWYEVEGMGLQVYDTLGQNNESVDGIYTLGGFRYTARSLHDLMTGAMTELHPLNEPSEAT